METETSGSKTYKRSAAVDAIMIASALAGHTYLFENIFNFGPGNPNARLRRGRSLGNCNGDPFQDSNGKWYYYGEKGCMRKVKKNAN